MIVAVAIFELHVPHAQSLKEKRMVVKSLRDRIRNRFEVSAAEVGLHDLHQRARLAVSLVTIDHAAADRSLSAIQEFAETAGDGQVVGWTQELLDFDENVPLGIPNQEWKDIEFSDEEDT